MSSVDGPLTRRDFLFYTGATVAGVTLGEAGRRQLALADERGSTWRGRGIERWATSVCRECPAGCGIRVRLVDDVPVKLEGNPDCPIARGRLCARGQAAIESYFDPDRLTGPARRIGKRGENKWQSVSWDEALQMVASRWPRDRRTGPAQPLALGGVERGPLAVAWNTTWRAAGAHIAWTTDATAAQLRPAFTALTGVDSDPLFDLEHATYVLSFSAPIVEDWLSPLWAQRSYGRFRRGAGHGRGRLVQVDARRSLTARKADEWIALPVEQQVVLAYGLASVILRERRVDTSFLEAFAGTLTEFESHVVARFSPDDIAALTGVPVVTVLRLARELAASSRPLVTVAADGERALVDAAFALNAIVGAFDRPGGVMASSVRPLDDLPDATGVLWEVAHGKRRPAALAFRDAAALRGVKAPVLDSVAVDAVAFIVSFSPYLDETARLADLLLPTHTALESWHLTAPATAVPAELVAAAAAAVPARLNTRDLTAVLEQVAGAVGAAQGAAPAKSSEQIVRDVLTPMTALNRGGPYSGPYETEWLRQLEQGGWWARTVDPDRAVDAVLHAGGWCDPGFQPGSIRESLRARGGLTFAPPANVSTQPRSARTADHAPSGDGAGRLRLVVFTPAAVNLAGNPNQPVLFELLGQPDGAPWTVWVELNPEVARSRRIRQGDRVRISSDAGAIEAQVQVADGMAPDCVAVSFVPGVMPAGRWAAYVHQDVRRLCGPAGFESACDVAVERA